VGKRGGEKDMGKILKFKKNRDSLPDEDKYLLDLYECMTRTIDGTVGTQIDKAFDLRRWHTDIEEYFIGKGYWEDPLDDMDEE